MLYNYKSDEFVQDVALEDIEILVDDISEEFYTLRRYNELDIYAPSYLAREIISRLLDEVDELWVHTDSHNALLYKDENEVLITIANDGMIFVEEARIKGVVKSCEDSSLAYVYDGFGKKDIDVLSEGAESILVFGFEEDYMDDECACDKCECSCKDDEKKAVSTTSATYKVNGKETDKETYDKALADFNKKYNELDEIYLDNIRDMLFRYCEFADEVNEWRKLFNW